MTFNEVLSQTIAMLQQHARVSYRALKRQVARDDAFLPEYQHGWGSKTSYTQLRLARCRRPALTRRTRRSWETTPAWCHGSNCHIPVG